MVGIVRFDQPVGDGELQLVRPEPARFALWREAQARPEVEQDIGGLGDDPFPGDQVGQREGRLPLRKGIVPGAAQDVRVIGAGVLQRQADEFAAALDFRPVVKAVLQNGRYRFFAV